MNTPSFQEDHISQVPALQLLQNLGCNYLRPQEVILQHKGRFSNVLLEGVLAEYGEDPSARLGERLRLDYGPGFSSSDLQDIRRIHEAFGICQTVSSKLLATGICQPAAGKSDDIPILQTVSRESGEPLRNDTRRRRRANLPRRSAPVPGRSNAQRRARLEGYGCSWCPPERRGLMKPRATPWEYRHHGSRALKGRNRATFPESPVSTGRGRNSLPPFQGFGWFNVYSQGVALGFIIVAFQAGDPGASVMRAVVGDATRAAHSLQCSI
jgi:hypothetical protein